MFTIPKDSVLSVDIIKNAIEYNEEERGRYNKLERYYKGDHDILYRQKPPTAKNTRIVVNHANYIVDTTVGYLLGNPVEYQVGEGYDIEKVKDQYRMQTISDLDHELVKDISIFGKQYELIYNVDNDVRSKDIDVRNAVCVYDDTVEHNKMFGIIYRKSERKGKFEDVIVYDKDSKYQCSDSQGNIVIMEGEPHRFGAVPLIEYRNNSEEMGDFEQVLSLIDAYNILMSDRVNDKEQLVEAILVGYNVTLEKDQMKDLLENRTMFGLPMDSKVEYLIKALDEGQIDILRQNLENDIHKIAKVPNMSDENFVGNASGVAIRYKLLAFEQSVSNKERYFEKGLLERFEIYNNYLVSITKMSKVPKYEVDVVFKRNLPQNDLEISQMINNLAGFVDDETLVGQVSFVDDAKEVVKKNREEEREKANLEMAQFGSMFPAQPNSVENPEEK